MGPYADAVHTVCLVGPTSDEPLRVDPQAAPDGALSPEDQAAVRELHRLLKEELTNQALWSEGARAEAAAHMDDFTLLRFIRARPDSIFKALEMFRGAMSYRSSHGVNQLFRELHPRAPEPLSERQRASRAYYFNGLGGLDRDGAPYFVYRLGRADLSGFAREPAILALMMEADAVNMETIFRTVRSASAALGTFVRLRVVVDLQGYAMSTLRHAGIIQAVMKVGPQVFPEGASKVLLVNAPRVFAAAWKVVSPWLPQRSRDKCSVISSSATPAALDECIAPEQLPDFLGGTLVHRQTCIGRAESVPTGIQL